MIQRSIPTWQTLSWHDELKNLITEPEQLVEALQLDPACLPAARQAAQLFPLRVTPSFVAKMAVGDANDPLLQQVLPLGAECEAQAGYVSDPLDEASANPIQGLIHKSHNRVLLVNTTSCAINCRYCFRREFDYSSNRISKHDWERIFSYLKRHPVIDEVIFSGGDPLLQSDEHFEWVIEELSKIPHIKRLRVHSRLPIVLPSRITTGLIDAFSASRFQNVWVVHCNHPNEIGDDVSEAFSAIKRGNITLLNQAVLLKGVNDCCETQVSLSHALFEHGVMPYYLHLLDKVSGAAHFDISEAQATRLYADMSARLSGYLLPKLVREEAGAISKTQVLATS